MLFKVYLLAFKIWKCNPKSKGIVSKTISKHLFVVSLQDTPLPNGEVPELAIGPTWKVGDGNVMQDRDLSSPPLYGR